MPNEGADIPYERCPSCGQEIPIHRGFSRWCAACEWNLNLEEDASQRSPLGRMYRGAGRRAARQLLESYINAPASALRPRMTIASLAAFIFVLGVHLVSLAVGGMGIYVIVTEWPKVFPVILGCLLLGVVWLLFPRVGRLPDRVLKQSEFPAIYALVAEISDRLGVEPVRHIAVDEEFNASIGNCGFRAVPLLTIGLPLWQTMDNPQRVALLSHEIAHRANGDPARGTFTYTALYTLHQWHEILTQELYDTGGIVELIVTLFMRMLAAVVEVLILVLSHLLWRNTQKAEYLADYLGTTVCGTDAMVETLDRIRVGADSLYSILTSNVTSVSQSGEELLRMVTNAMEQIPEHERERIRRIDRAMEGSLDATHPPTEFRIQFLEHHRIDAARVYLSGERAADIAAELAPLEESIGKKLIYAVLGEQ